MSGSASPLLAGILCFAGLARAQTDPQPPCAGEPFPAYPAVGGPPAVKVWDRSTWTPPPCVGWTASDASTVVATAARFRYDAGLEGLRRRAGAVSQLAGLLYWSTTSQKWQPFIVDAYALTSPSDGQRRGDFQLEEITEGRTLYTRQEDNLFGKAVYRVRILRASGERLVFATENASAISFLSVPVFAAGELQSIVFVVRESKDVWRYYGIARTGKQASLLVAGHEASLINRAAATYRFLAGIPANQEPPAAR